MLCKAGGLTKRDIGAIRIQQNETLVEIDAALVDAFFEHIGPDGRLEKSIRAMRMDHPQKPSHSERQPRLSARGAHGTKSSSEPDGEKANRKAHRAPASGPPPSANPSPKAGKKRKWDPAH